MSAQLFVIFFCLPFFGQGIVTKQDNAADRSNSFITGVAGVWDAISYELVDMEHDVDIGPDMGLQFMASQKSFETTYTGGGPKNLKEYCSGATDQEHKLGMTEGKRVYTNWEEYGTYYPGTITKVHSDATYKVHYDDGFDEDHVDAKQMRAMTDKEKDQDRKKQRNDPACKFQNFVETVKPKVKELKQKMGMWLTAQRARLSKATLPGAPRSAADRLMAPLASEEGHGRASAGSLRDGELAKDKTAGGRQQGDAAAIRGQGDAAAIKGQGDAAAIKGQGDAAAIKGQGDAAAIKGQGDAAAIKGQGDAAAIKGQGDAAAIKGQGDAAAIRGQGDAAAIKGQGDAAAIRGQGDSAAINGQGDAAAINGQGDAAAIRGHGESADIAAAPNGLLSGAAPAPAQAQPPMTDDEAKKIAAMKSEIDDNDIYIEKLKLRERENAEKLKQAIDPDEPASAPGTKTVDDLINEYSDRIASQKDEIGRRLKHIEEQELELARVGASQIPLSGVSGDAMGLMDQVKKATKEMMALDAEGEMDPDLKHILDGVLRPIKNIHGQVGSLMNLNEKAEKDKEEEDKKVKIAADDARKNALNGGASKEEAEKAAEKAGLKAEEAALDKVKGAEMDTLKAAQTVESEMKKSESETEELDTGLHPHGNKWWRYRYEHSYIEAWIMIFISILMCFWRFLVQKMRSTLQVWALPHGTKQKHELGLAIGEGAGRDDGSLHLEWLSGLMELTLTCVLVFITVWAVCKTSLVDVLPLIMVGNGLYLPQTGEQYRHLAIDCSSIYFFAIFMYFAIVFPVCIDATKETHRLAKGFVTSPREMGQNPDAFWGKRSQIAANLMGTLARGKSAYEKDRLWFINCMRNEIKHRDEPEVQKLKDRIGDNWDQFPLDRYLIMTLHVNTSVLFHFEWRLWLLVVITFFCFAALHCWCHMGYLRIMMTFTMLSFGIIMAISWFTKSIGGFSEQDEEERTKIEKKHEGSIHTRHNTESYMLIALKFALFFNCYGAARMICHSWMWVLHFWPVLLLTVMAIVLATLIIVLVLPVIPSFCAVMGLPPYINRRNMKIMLHAVKAQKAEDEKRLEESRA